jgi:hypothetical protein
LFYVAGGRLSFSTRFFFPLLAIVFSLFGAFPVLAGKGAKIGVEVLFAV